uniref:Uncharacterized protein n=1 Tax=Oryza brachyantha TaxID=4533 RepID=J3MRT1_ORYBR
MSVVHSVLDIAGAEPSDHCEYLARLHRKLSRCKNNMVVVICHHQGCFTCPKNSTI